MNKPSRAVHSQFSTLNSQLPKGYKQTEVGVIPEDWEVIQLGNIASFKTGPFGSALHKSDYVIGGIPIVNPMQIIKGCIEPTETMSISESAAKNLSEFRLRAKDIVIGRRGEMGRCAFVLEEQTGWLCGTGSMIVRTDNNIDGQLIQRQLSSPPIIAEIENTSVGSTMINLNQATLSNLYIPLPPTLAEQEAIAGALSDADEWIAALTRLIAKKRQIKQATMQTLLTGQKRLPEFDKGQGYKQTELGEIPKDWDVDLLETFAIKVGSGITPKGGSSVYEKTGRPFMRSQNVGWGVLQLSDIAYIDEETHSSFLGSEIIQNDVLLNITGASIGRCSLASSTIAGGNVNQHVCIIRVNERLLDAGFLSRTLLSDIGQRQISSFQAGGNREGLNFAQIKSFNIPLPPTKAEQTAIATILSDMDAQIAALEGRLNKARHIKQGMMSELLTGKTRLIEN